MQTSRRHRRGNYSVLMAFMLTALLGAGALVLDWSRARIAGSQAQAIADAAAQAGVIALRTTGNATGARQASELVVQRNEIAGITPQLLSFEVGGWTTTTRSWRTGGTNAVRVTVGRTGANAINLPLAAMFGVPTMAVSRSSTAATQNLQVVLVIDITSSWDKDDFYKARTATGNFLTSLHNAHGDNDIVGMTLFLQRFGWEFTPFTNVQTSSTNAALVKNKWAALNIGSLPGRYNAAYEVPTRYDIACDVYSSNNFNNPSGGCFPNLPRYYLDEGGTDHSTGMSMARTMFQERPDPYAYRAMVVLTDGRPNGYSTSTNSARSQAHYNEARWREYKYTGSRTNSQIETAVVNLARAMYTTDNVNIWFVSFVEYKSFMEQASQGDGYFDLAASGSEIIDIFDHIAQALPVAVVQ
jgi:Flp pilus assembly protein TadG